MIRVFYTKVQTQNWALLLAPEHRGENIKHIVFYTPLCVQGLTFEPQASTFRPPGSVRGGCFGLLVVFGLWESLQSVLGFCPGGEQR